MAAFILDLAVACPFCSSTILRVKKDRSSRKDFIKMATIGLGAFSMDPVLAGSGKPKTAAGIDQEKKLRIVCVGAHPGDPEFGCGGTMAKYIAAGHQVTCLYLTRGEA